MNLQVAFDSSDLQKSIEIAKKIKDYVDTFELGPLMLYVHGVHAIEHFKQELPNKTLLVDSKIIEKGKEIAAALCKAGADWVTVMAGTDKNIIHATTSNTHALGKKIMLDLTDAASVGQSCLEAKDLGINAIMFNQPYDDKNPLIFLDKWEMVQGNTNLPIYIAAKPTKKNIENILNLKPAGVVIGKAIVEATDPYEEAKFFYDLLHKKI